MSFANGKAKSGILVLTIVVTMLVSVSGVAGQGYGAPREEEGPISGTSTRELMGDYVFWAFIAVSSVCGALILYSLITGWVPLAARDEDEEDEEERRRASE